MKKIIIAFIAIPLSFSYAMVDDASSTEDLIINAIEVDNEEPEIENSNCNEDEQEQQTPLNAFSEDTAGNLQMLPGQRGLLSQLIFG